MVAKYIGGAFLEAGREFATAGEFCLRDLLDRVSAKGATQKDIGEALGISAGHIGRLMRGYPIAVRDHALKRLHELSGIELKRLIYANALNAYPEEAGADWRESAHMNPCAPHPGLDTWDRHNHTPTSLGVPGAQSPWNQRGVIGYCRLPVTTFNDTFYQTLPDNLLRYASWEPATDHKRLPSLGGLNDLLYVRAATPLMEMAMGDIYTGERVVPRGAIVELELRPVSRIANGSIVYVQFDNEPADFYSYQITENASIFTSRNSRYPARVMASETSDIDYRILGVATRIVEKTL